LIRAAEGGPTEAIRRQMSEGQDGTGEIAAGEVDMEGRGGLRKGHEVLGIRY